MTPATIGGVTLSALAQDDDPRARAALTRLLSACGSSRSARDHIELWLSGWLDRSNPSAIEQTLIAKRIRKAFEHAFPGEV